MQSSRYKHSSRYSTGEVIEVRSVYLHAAKFKDTELSFLPICNFLLQAVGEPPLFLSASVFFAIKDAISSARFDAGLKGTFRLDSPASSERIRMACQDQFTSQVV